MANNYSSLKLSYSNAFDFVKSFSDAEFEDHVKYVFLSNSTPYDNESVIPDISDTLVDERSVWDKMYAAKRVTGNDVELVVKRIDWATGTVYKEYDDNVDLSSLLPEESGANSIYVLTSDLNVYKCVHNNNGGQSTVEPSGYQYTSNGYFTTADNYVWKYMYGIKSSNKFLTAEWMPTPTSVNALEYNTSSENLLDGAIANIVVENGGSGYIHSSINAESFSTSTTVLDIIEENISSFLTTNMFVNGTGIVPGTYITNVNPTFNQITLSQATISAGGTIANTLSATTGIFLDGDGNEDLSVTINLSNTSIEKVGVDSVATGYNYVTLSLYGTGSNALLRPVISPKYGHGFNPAKELGATSVMISKIIGSLDSTEDGLISVDTTFRQFGLLSNPHKYNEITTILNDDADIVISQTTDFTMIGGIAYDLNEVVYQGSSLENSTFSAILHAQDLNTVRLTNIRGTPTVGGLLIGDGSGVQRAISVINNPTFQPYTGDILYVENTLATNRAEAQAEIIKFVVTF